MYYYINTYYLINMRQEVCRHCMISLVCSIKLTELVNNHTKSPVFPGDSSILCVRIQGQDYYYWFSNVFLWLSS